MKVQWHFYIKLNSMSSRLITYIFKSKSFKRFLKLWKASKFPINFLINKNPETKGSKYRSKCKLCEISSLNGTLCLSHCHTPISKKFCAPSSFFLPIFYDIIRRKQASDPILSKFHPVHHRKGKKKKRKKVFLFAAKRLSIESINTIHYQYTQCRRRADCATWLDWFARKRVIK